MKKIVDYSKLRLKVIQKILMTIEILDKKLFQ